MIAINGLDGQASECFLPDEVILNFEPRAAFWFNFEKHIIVLLPVKGEPDYHHRFAYYQVCDTWYESLITADYKTLKQLEPRTRNLTLSFDEEIAELEEEDD